MLNMQLQTLKQIRMLAYFGDIQGICFHVRLECVRLWSADVKPSVLFYDPTPSQIHDKGYDPV